MKCILRILRVCIALLRQTCKDVRLNIHHMKFNRQMTGEYDFSQLRMYCHMLDKGLNNPLFERGHSGDVYVKAKLLHERLIANYADDPSFIWATNVIKHYERAQVTGVPELEHRANKEYSIDEKETFREFIMSRTSCRCFHKRKISDTILQDVVRLAVDAPNGCCRQTVRFYITQNESKIIELRDRIAGMTNFSQVQALVAVCAETSFYDLIDKNLQYVDASLAAENFILAARIYGIYGTICNFFHAKANEISFCKSILEISESENIIMFIAMGYPVFVPEKPLRRSVASFLRLR